MAKRVVTFGEIMLRLQPDNYLRFVQVDHYEATYGGGEANVSVSLAEIITLPPFGVNFLELSARVLIMNRVNIGSALTTDVV